MTALDDDHLRTPHRITAAGVRVPIGELNGHLLASLAFAAATLGSPNLTCSNDHSLHVIVALLIVELGLCCADAEHGNKDQQGQVRSKAARPLGAKPSAVELIRLSHITSFTPEHRAQVAAEKGSHLLMFHYFRLVPTLATSCSSPVSGSKTRLGWSLMSTPVTRTNLAPWQ